MTNRERLNSLSDKEFAKELCNIVEMTADNADVDMCDVCPFTRLCKKGRSGFLAWLNQEAEDK